MIHSITRFPYTQDNLEEDLKMTESLAKDVRPEMMGRPTMMMYTSGQGPMTEKIYVGQTVHYKSYGSPGGEYASVCRAAIVTEVQEHYIGGQNLGYVSLCVLNPEGLYFNRSVPYNKTANIGGLWHFIDDCKD
jgi:hypothetical protein